MTRPPNILIVMPDQMQADVTRPGHPCQLPNVQRLAAEGLRFSNASTSSPHCCPSRAAFFTGHLPSRHGIWNSIDSPKAFGRDLAAGIGTFAEPLAAAGYRLGFAGKWHVSALRGVEAFGWTRFAAVTPPLMPRRPIAPTPAIPTPVVDDPAGELPRPGWNGDTRIFKTLPASQGEANWGWDTIQSGVNAIRTLAAGTGPWCAFVSPDPPHDPYTAPVNYLDLYARDGVELPASFADTLEDKPRIAQRQRRQLWDRLGEAGNRECLRHYWASCSLVDNWLGMLLDTLDATGQADDTLVLFVSDHGDYAGAHGLWCKGIAAFREAYAIPAIMRWPAGIVRPGRTVDDLVSIADFAPTFLALAGVSAPDGIHGRSLTPFLAAQQPQDWREVLVGQVNGFELHYTQRVIWSREWKYVFNGHDFDELYDLRQDPHELVNLAYPTAGAASAADADHVAWPRLSTDLDGVRQRLLRHFWQIARDHGDHFANSYWTVGLAPYGPDMPRA